MTDKQTIRRPCNVCGAEAHPSAGGCTNGRCTKCHYGRYCSPGGIYSDGHNLTTPESYPLRAQVT